MNNIKVDITTKLCKIRAKTALRIQNDFGQGEECIKLNDALNLIGQVRLIVQSKFYKENEAYIVNATKMSDKANEVLSTINEVGKAPSDFAYMASDLVVAMQENNSPILCIRVEDYNDAVNLTRCYQKLLLLRKYEKDMPDGTTQLEHQEIEFENLCEKYKIGRRTKSVIKNQFNKY